MTDDDRNLDLTPHWDRVSPEYADAHIEEKIKAFGNEKQREGLRNVDKALRDVDAPPGLRLHYVSTLAHLGQQGRGRAKPKPRFDDVPKE